MNLSPLLVLFSVFALTTGAARNGASIAPGVQLRLETPTVQADNDFLWTLSFTVANTGPTGLYFDSLYCDVESLDPGVADAKRHTRLNLSGAARLIPTVSAGDVAHFAVRVPPPAEHAQLMFVYFAHRSDGSPAMTTLAATAEPGPASARTPSEFLAVGDRKIEYVSVKPESDSLAAGLLYIPADDQNARSALRSIQPLVRRGIHVVTLSLPGSGSSSGDVSGAAAVAAASALIDQMKRMPGIDGSRLAIWGVQRGAAVAALAAADRHDLRAVICESGCYDPKACASGVAGSRSPLAAVNQIHAPVLVLHGGADSVAPASQAHAFATALTAAGVTAREEVMSAGGHDL
ncbi:MAG TPA: dienelactone hydrolase family protein, partial [Candidatus Udaeobacter sp.]|nr:dienelactone hydrolase family protein [Candidatus Udaeobacter sp.]